MKLLTLLFTGLTFTCTTFAQTKTPIPGKIWNKEKANQWYKNQPWLVGANYIPASAINQLEMWQSGTFDYV